MRHQLMVTALCMCQLCMCFSVDTWIYHCSPSVLYNTRIMCVTKHLTFLAVEMITRSARGPGCFTPLINSMVRSGHAAVRSCYILCLAVAIIESVIRSRSPYVYNWWGRVVLHQPSTECKKCNNHYSQSQCKYSPPAISSNVFLVFRIQCNGIMGGGIFTFLIFFTCRLSRS